MLHPLKDCFIFSYSCVIRSLVYVHTRRSSFLALRNLKQLLLLFLSKLGLRNDIAKSFLAIGNLKQLLLFSIVFFMPLELLASDYQDVVATTLARFKKEEPQMQTRLADVKPMEHVNAGCSEKEGFFIFVSFSMAKEQLLALDQIAKKVGARLLIRGLKDDSFKVTVQLIRGIHEEGMAIDIDPTAFASFNVQEVPAFVIAQKGMFDKMTGNVSPIYALETFKKEGDLKEEASRYLGRLS